LLEKQKITFHKLEFSSVNSMRNCLKRGVGYSLCPAVSVEKELADGSLSAIKWGGGHFETSVIMIWHAEKWCSPVLNHFMRLTKNMISD
jgi:DNA-binding transcriptional LysR family regulator